MEEASGSSRRSFAEAPVASRILNAAVASSVALAIFLGGPAHATESAERTEQKDASETKTPSAADVLPVTVSRLTPPTVTHIAPELSVSFPQPLQIGAQVQCEGSFFFCDPHLRYYIDGGYFRIGVGSGGSKDLSLYSFELGTRYFPFSFPLYFAAGFGYRHIAFSADMSSFQLDSESVATTANLDLATFYVTPSIGFNIGLTRHLSFGMDLGAQLPVISSGKMWLYDSNSGQSSDTSPELQMDSGRAMDRVAGLIIPKLTLVRLTYNLD